MQILYFVAASALICDQLTKFLAISFLKPVSSVPIWRNVFHLSYVENTGIAFGWFQGRPEFWSIVISASVLVLLVASPFFLNHARSRQLAFGLILGGAVGNWIDRMRFDYVIDFLDFQIWPVFNLADSFITIGALLFIWFTLRGRSCTRF